MAFCVSIDINLEMVSVIRKEPASVIARRQAISFFCLWRS